MYSLKTFTLVDSSSVNLGAENIEETEKEVISEEIELSNGNKAIIPNGFKFQEYIKNDDEENISIKISNGNNLSFVWIPVENIGEFENATETIDELREESSEGEVTKTQEDTSKNTEEYKKMIESIEKYGGYYVSEAELSVDNNGYVANKFRNMGNLGTDEEGNILYGIENGEYYRNGNIKTDALFANCNINNYDKVKEVANGLYNTSATVTSHVMYGNEYDHMLKWIMDTNSEEIKEKILKDSSNIGKYQSNLDKEGNITNEGLWDETALNGLYGLGGNLWEVTQENSDDLIALRGGCYTSRGDENPIAYKRWASNNDWSYDVAGNRVTQDGHIGMRVSFYIKTEYEENAELQSLKEKAKEEFNNIYEQAKNEYGESTALQSIKEYFEKKIDEQINATLLDQLVDYGEIMVKDNYCKALDMLKEYNVNENTELIAMISTIQKTNFVKEDGTLVNYVEMAEEIIPNNIDEIIKEHDKEIAINSNANESNNWGGLQGWDPGWCPNRFSFLNTVTDFWKYQDGTQKECYYLIDASYLDIVKKGIPNGYKDLIDSRMWKAWGGSCFGMVMGEMAYWDKQITPSYWHGSETTMLEQLPAPARSFSTSDLVNSYHLSQFRPENWDDWQTNIRRPVKSGHWYKADDSDLVSRIISNLSNGEICLVTFAAMEPSGNTWGHAVLACGYIDMGNGWYQVAILDPNYWEWRAMWIPKDCSTWYYDQTYDFAQDGDEYAGNLGLVLTRWDIPINPETGDVRKYTVREKIENWFDSLSIGMSKNTKDGISYTISKGEKKVVVDAGKIIQPENKNESFGNCIVPDITGSRDSNNLTFVQDDIEGNYSITSQDTGRFDLLIDLPSQVFGSMNAENADKLEVGNNSLRLTGNKDNYEFEIGTDDTTNILNDDNIKIIGSRAKDIYIESSDKGVIITADDLSDATIIDETYETNLKYEIKVNDSNNVLVTKTEDNVLQLFSDNNEDGTYEELIGEAEGIENNEENISTEEMEIEEINYEEPIEENEGKNDADEELENNNEQKNNISENIEKKAIIIIPVVVIIIGIITIIIIKKKHKKAE